MRAIVAVALAALLCGCVCWPNPGLPPSGSGDCQAKSAGIKDDIRALNSCSADSDCAMTGFGCPFGCYSLVHRGPDLEAARKRVSDYQASCGACIYDCEAPRQGALRCVSGACAIAPSNDTGSSGQADCKYLMEDLSAKLMKANYCKEASDCVSTTDFYRCRATGCYALINRGHDMAQARDALARYADGCQAAPCNIMCAREPAQGDIGCVGGRCVDSRQDDAGGLEIREWGVLAGCPANDTFFLTSRPQQSMMVKQPVIYVHSTDKEPLTVRVTFSDGRPTDTYPKAEVSGSQALWADVGFSSCAPSRAKSMGAAGYVGLDSILSALNDVDADCLIYKGQESRFLFYEGELRFENKVQVSLDFDAGKATFRNLGEYPVYDAAVVVPTEPSNFMNQRLYSSYAKIVPSGGEETVELKSGVNVGLSGQLVSQGFSRSEAESFSGLWSTTFFTPTNVGNWSNLVYRLSPEEYGQMIALDVDPKPRKTIRSLYVLVHMGQSG